MAQPRIRLERTALLVVDMQERLLPHMHNAASVERQVGLLLDGAAALEVPVLVTEQYRKGLGPTVGGLQPKIARAVCNEEKLLFSALVEPIARTLRELRRTTVLVCGIEAHVCVMQTCLDLLDAGYVTALALDAIGSRRQTDQEAAQQRLLRAGVLATTVESALLEMVQEAGTSRFKAVLPLIK